MKNLKIQSKIKKLTALAGQANRWSLVAYPAARRQEGMALAVSLIVLGNILIIAFAIGIFSINQLKIAASTRDSAYAIFAATSGLERALYQVRKGADCANISKTDMDMATSLSYQVIIPPLSCPVSPTTITSYGTYRQTSRIMEAEW